MLRVLYDGFIYGLQSNGGINRYFSELIARLPEDFSPALLSTLRREQNFPHHPRLRVFEHARFAFRPGRLAYWLEQHLFRRDMRSFSPHIIHPSYHHTLLRLAPKDIPGSLVYTAYDCLYDVFAEQYDPKGIERAALQVMLERADRVLAISEATKSDIVHYYGLAPEKIRVQYLGASLCNLPQQGEEEKKKADHETPYFLFVGNRWHYKRFPLALRAFQILHERKKDVELYVVGPPFNPDEKSMLPQGVREIGPVSDAELALFYRHALALVYPSVYEGFGLPVLEAMSLGTPVIACQRASLPEVAGKAGILIEPDNLEALHAAMELLLESESERSTRSLLGREQAKHFSWEQASRVLLKTYEELG